MTITIETLKENRTQIIERITNEFGESAVKDIMSKMAGDLDWNSDIDFADVNEYMDMIFDQVEFARISKPDSKMVAMFNDAHVDEKFNHITKSWEKY